jgi:hypothetical protein
MTAYRSMKPSTGVDFRIGLRAGLTPRRLVCLTVPLCQTCSTATELRATAVPNALDIRK